MKNQDVQLEQIVRQVLSEVLNQKAQPSSAPSVTDKNGDGVYSCIDAAIKAAYAAQQKLSAISLEKRVSFIEAMRRTILAHAEDLARLSVEETGMGRVKDKIQKNILAARKTPGVEDIQPVAYTGDHGFTLVERAPYGLIGAITPSTNPSETIICNGIGMIAAGNSVVFNPHPSARRVAQLAVRLLNQAIVGEGGPPDLLTCPAEPNSETGMVLMKHPDIRILVVTGGPEIVRIAMGSGKKVIAAGPGNPPVVVDGTADIDEAATGIVAGASFDNNLLCISEKVVFAESIILEQLKKTMCDHGAYELNSEQVARLMDHITIQREGGQLFINKKFVGKNVQLILKQIGITVDERVCLAIAEVEDDHPLVRLEQLMPVLPIVRSRSVDHAIEQAVKAEQGNYHTALMYSRDIENLSKMARAVNTSIFVKNGPSYAGLGYLGEGFTTYTIASPTGEGLTSAISFTRMRRCVLKDRFRIV